MLDFTDMFERGQEISRNVNILKVFVTFDAFESRKAFLSDVKSEISVSSVVECFAKAAQPCPKDLYIYGKLIGVVLNSFHYLASASIWRLFGNFTEQASLFANLYDGFH